MVFNPTSRTGYAVLILGADKLVADASNGFQVAGRKRSFADFLPDAGDIYIDAAVVAVLGGLAESRVDFIAGDDAPGLAAQIPDHL